MTIYDIIKDTNYLAEQFSSEAIDRRNTRIEERTGKKGKVSAVVKCLNFKRKQHNTLNIKKLVLSNSLLSSKLAVISKYNY